MPYYTQLPASFATVNADTGLIELGDTGVLNGLPDAQQFDLYDVDETTATTLVRGEDITLIDMPDED